MAAPRFEASPALEAFLWAEIRNEDDGGVSPTTLSSALDSLAQMPRDILDELVPGGASLEGLAAEIRMLIGIHGSDLAVEIHLD